MRGRVPLIIMIPKTHAGGFSGMTVSVTQEGNIFFDIKLHDVIPIDVNLYIEYTPLNNPTSTIPIITKDGFINTENIIYLERAPPQAILDTEFTLQVALITQNLEMGPKSDKSRVLGKSLPICVCTCSYAEEVRQVQCSMTNAYLITENEL